MASAVRLVDLLDAGAVPEVPLCLAGARRAGAEVVQDHAPATGALLATVHLAGPEEVHWAVEAAMATAARWEATPVSERASCLRELAGRLLADRDRMALVDALDTGSPVSAMRADVEKGAAFVGSYAGAALEMQGRTIPASATGWHVTMPSSFGVVGAITAYNHPTLFTCLKTAPALLAGNTVVLKPPAVAPLSAVAFASLADGVLPPGVLNVVPGAAPAGAALVGHPAVGRITFTGSLTTGLAVQRAAAASGVVKHLTLELGGKNPIVVFDDVDLDEAAGAVVRGMNFTRVQGQSCGSTSRLLASAAIVDDLVERVVHLVARIEIGLPEVPGTEMGSLVSDEHRRRVDGFARRATTDGARLRHGGTAPQGRPDLDGGAFYLPTVFDRVAPDMALARDEVFGPILAVLAFGDEHEALRLANNTPYGLTAAVWTKDIDRALRVARAVEAGYVWINDVERRYPGVPFGGWKQSGAGSEQGLAEELLSFTRRKSVNVAVRPAAGMPPPE